jgi:hypothetical protein
MNIDKFVEMMEVQRNIANERKREQEVYEQGVRAMRLAGNQESN